jgi:predicted metal-dependent hydrolase
MPTINDKEFGAITLTRSAKASRIRIKVGTDGTLRASMPLYAPVLFVRQLIASSRSEIRELLRQHQSSSIFTSEMQIGKSHTLITRPSSGDECSVSHHGQQIIVTLPPGTAVEDPAVQALIRPAVITALRKEAKSYLPRRLAHLAEGHGFSYKKVRFSHAAGRWGSCSSSGTISLNIALMKLPFPLIDYVLVHELSHTVQMNHSSAFWEIVEKCDPDFKAHRREMKNYSPSI